MVMVVNDEGGLVRPIWKRILVELIAKVRSVPTALPQLQPDKQVQFL